MEVSMHRQFTEPIFVQLADYRAQLVKHPLFTAAQNGELSRSILHEFAFHQFSDSILWIPMLAQMKSKSLRSRRLRQAIEDNIGHEAGLSPSTTGHVTLAVAMMRSLGLTSLDGFPTSTFEHSASLWLSDGFERMSEASVAGFLLTAETLVPLMFAALAPSFAAIGCDTRYFDEHIHVDSDEHATWMAEAVDEIVDIEGIDCLPAISAGMDDAWKETREIPDLLWSRRCVSS
jgi:pyrroloquinoline quinone (PQQ) biosynthesis protein C